MAYLHPFGSTQIENIENIKIGGQGPVLFCYDQEPLLYEYNQNIFKVANNYRDDYSNKRITILLNTERNSENKTKIINQFKFIDCYYFFHAFAAADWYRGYQYCRDLIHPKQRKIKKKYITFNRITGMARVYRSFFIAELAKLNLLDYGHVSFSKNCPEHGHFESHMRDSIITYDLQEQYVNESINQINKITNPLRIDFRGEKIPNSSQVIRAIPEMMESFLHVVTETCFWEKKEHLTEKIFKPIVARQPFLLLGCANNLSYLRSYGFKTFDRWWDESYDTIEDPLQRLAAVVKIIKKICSYSDSELEKLLTEMSDVLNYNYEKFYSKEFINEVWKELTTNLNNSVAEFRSRIYQENQFQENFDILDCRKPAEFQIEI